MTLKQKQVLIDVDAEEFILFIRLLTSLPTMNSVQGRQDLVNIIMAQSELDKPFDVSKRSIRLIHETFLLLILISINNIPINIWNCN